MAYSIIIAVLLLFILILLSRYTRLQRGIRRISRTTSDIRSGNFNRRYRLPSADKPLTELSEELNRLIDYVQKSFERTAFLEEERKRMIANISHDLRTPLTSLLGYMEALQQDASLSPEEKETFLGIAVGKGDDLLVLLQNFFELARLETEDSIPELHKLNLSELIPEILVDFYPAFVKAGLTPVMELPEEPLFVIGDTAVLRRIVNNLLSNSLRYGADGGELGITVREESGKVWVDVWDRGKGIPERDLPHIFERLYTGEASRNTSLRGTGLGLAIVRNLVGKLGSQITVSSTPNEKTVFTFSLMKS
ncbi:MULTISPECIES: HAMP domain-containing sensor histidine kinase [unclassified Paenibacillus]|uniref:sensor histidine kinase n=1 Tax=unclassified Paenibacillus TaxID=185978 RepID=UPI00104AF7A1|nr:MULTISPECIES: HAMP domain-containing sensor histidine kinase [unclassified Paenibacillus]NIK71366.1 signal transduction histidine kinase [Paenibacillus sp. BK720]TCM96916.1 phospho-acceptor domain-containing protein [Paenibacillus sp. BK033]